MERSELGDYCDFVIKQSLCVGAHCKSRMTKCRRWRDSSVCVTIKHIVTHKGLAMRSITIREAREGLSHPELLFADNDEVIVTRHGEPVARILPIKPRSNLHSLKNFLASQPMQTVPSEAVLAADREDRC